MFVTKHQLNCEDSQDSAGEYNYDYILRKEDMIMANLKHTIQNANDKVAGKVKETVGKATGNDKMELKGKIQSVKADIKGKIQNITD